jgi:hypothetical protein
MRQTKLKEEIMTARTKDTKLFHRLVNAQRKNNTDIDELDVGNKLFCGQEEVLMGFKEHFQNLATEKFNPNFDEKYNNICKNEVKHIIEIAKQTDTYDVTVNEFKDALSLVNKGKSSDYYGLTIEHILHAEEVVIEYLLYIYNQIFSNGETPDIIKTGLLTPAFKNKGNRTSSTSYRGITVLPVLNKIMEVILKLRIQPRVLSIQSPAQRGFTAKTSPLNTSFIIEELKRNAKDEKDILITILLDAKSAFDVVNPEHLMRRLYHAGISNKIGTLIYSLHCNATSAIKWKGDISTFFDMKHGVRQGGILSADLYKIYVNPLLEKLINTGIGSKVGDIICNTSACADDVTINATTENEA